jgi:two-component system, NarL family, nitrate/nitrite response regulator NarL
VRKSASVIIVSPRVLLREGVASLLQNTPYKVVAGATRPAELSHARYPTGQRRLAIVGADGENLDEAHDSIRLLRSSMPDTKVLLIVETNGSIDLQHVLALSPDACVFNLGPRDTLIKVLELTLMDQRVFVLGESTATAPSKTNVTTASYNDVTSPTTGLLSAYSYRLGTNSQTALSPRERQILISLAEGKSNKTIARFYNLSEATVKVHLKAILRKTKTHNRTQAAIWAIEHGLRDS